MKKNKSEELIELEIEKIGFEGISIARKNEQVFFVKNGLPGDTVIAKLKKRNRKFNETTIKEIVNPSKYRVEPICEYFGSCGGCTWQCLEYEQQLFWKKQHVIDAHKRLGKIEAKKYFDTIPAKKTLQYRNKMDFSFSTSRWLTTKEIQSEKKFDNHFTLGLHIPGRFDKVLDINSCQIQIPEWNKILNFIRQKAISSEIEAFNTYSQQGFLKGLCLRNSLSKSETMINLITTSPRNQNDKNFINWYKFELSANFPFISSTVHTVNNQNSVNIGEIQFIEGNLHITESILGLNYQISPFSFFQTNSNQLDSFIKLILDSAQLKKSDIIWDLYCGTGSITLPASKLCSKIYGIELIESAVNDAKINAKNNEISNVEFFAADLHSTKIPELLKTLPKPNVIIIDPPRNGMNPNLISHLLTVAPFRLIYVSCNPATQARDLAELSEKYDIIEVYPFDMFPHTYHIEIIAVLEKK